MICLKRAAFMANDAFRSESKDLIIILIIASPEIKLVQIVQVDLYLMMYLNKC